MTLRLLIATLGLAFELTGGLMLSLHIFQSVNTFLRPLNWLSNHLSRWRDVLEGRLVGAALAIGYAGAAVVAVVIGPGASESLLGKLALGVLLLVAGAGAVIFAALGLRRFLLRVAGDETTGDDEETRTRRIGQFGFLFLAIGFVLQGVVNFMTPS